MAATDVVIVSNRGPISFNVEADGSLRARRGAGGLVSGLGPLVIDSPTTWIAAALSAGDREAAASGVIEAEGFRVRTLAIDPADFAAAYDVVCNATLWFLHHGLFDLAREPMFDRAWWAAWDAYRRVNQAFVAAIAEEAPEGATVLVQDYHLALCGPGLAERRPDLATVHFSHTPFAGPEAMAVLPETVRAELLGSMAAHGACGFHSRRWADGFEGSHRATFGPDATPPNTFVSALAPDPVDMAAVAASAACEQAFSELDAHLGGRLLVTRVDRIELSKNLLRGFQAFDALLHDRPELRGRVVFGAFGYPSRQGVPAYAAYQRSVEEVVAEINARWGTPDWVPVLYDATDDFPRSVAALRRADVLLVNPIRDGLNLVAKEGPLVNQRDGVLVLSTEAGAWAELSEVALGVNPFDVRATAEALDRALSMTPAERSAHAAAVRSVAAARTPADWLADQLAAVAPPRPTHPD